MFVSKSGSKKRGVCYSCLLFIDVFIFHCTCCRTFSSRRHLARRQSVAGPRNESASEFRRRSDEESEHGDKVTRRLELFLSGTPRILQPHRIRRQVYILSRQMTGDKRSFKEQVHNKNIAALQVICPKTLSDADYVCCTFY